MLGLDKLLFRKQETESKLEIESKLYGLYLDKDNPSTNIAEKFPFAICLDKAFSQEMALLWSYDLLTQIEIYIDDNKFPDGNGLQVGNSNMSLTDFLDFLFDTGIGVVNKNNYYYLLEERPYINSIEQLIQKLNVSIITVKEINESFFSDECSGCELAVIFSSQKIRKLSIYNII